MCWSGLLRTERGTMLLECVLALALLLIILPGIYGYFFRIQHQILTLVSQFDEVAEQSYIKNYLFQELHAAVRVNVVSPQSLQFQLSDVFVTYSLKEGHFRREQVRVDAGVTKKSTVFLNHHWVLHDLRFSWIAPHVVQVQMVGADRAILEWCYVPF